MSTTGHEPAPAHIVAARPGPRPSSARAQVGRDDAFRRIFESCAEGICLTDLEGIVTLANPAMAEMLGYTAAEMVGRHMREFVLPSEQPTAWREEPVERFEAVFRHRDGHPVYGIVALTSYDDGEGRLLGSLGMVTDISARKQAEEELDRIFTLSTDLFAVLDTRARFLRCNPAWYETTGYRPGDLVGRSAFSFMDAEARARGREAAQVIARGRPVRSLRLRFTCADGSERWLSWSASVDLEGGRIYAVVRDVTDLVRAERAQQEMLEALRSNTLVLEEQVAMLDELRIRAEYIASHDALTGALNRGAWFEQAARGRSWTIALFDIDHFKKVNDTYGHPAGDAVLKEVVRRLQPELGGAPLGRLGGEEFGALFEGPLERAAAYVGRAIRVTLSAGLAPWQPVRRSREASLARTYEVADRALYRAKRQGRARLVSLPGRERAAA